MLRVSDPALATTHLIALVTAAATARPPGGAPAPGAEAADAMVVAGVEAFLDGYRTR